MNQNHSPQKSLSTDSYSAFSDYLRKDIHTVRKFCWSFQQFLYYSPVNFYNRTAMFKKLFFICSLVFFLASCSKENNPAQNGISVQDDLGTIHRFAKIPQRIITLAPNLSEMIYDLGLEKKLVGNTLYCDYPEAAKEIEKVGNLLTVNFEKIVTLKPDLVFITVEGNTKETYDKFHQLGIKIFVSNPRNFEGIKKTYSDFGKIFQIEEMANNKISKWDSTIARILISAKIYTQKSAMFVIDLKPLMLAGKNTFLNEVLQICGLKNIADDSPVNYPMFSREEILKRDPDYIIYPTGGDDNVTKIKSAYPEWSRIRAIKNKNVFFVDWNLYSRPGPRFTNAVNDLFTRLHPLEK
jgi:iron complex transport system substrate-binding protein